MSPASALAALVRPLAAAILAVPLLAGAASAQGFLDNLPAATPLPEPVPQGERLQIGITLHPYYSFAANVVGDLADVVPLIGAEVNPHGYQPQAADIERATGLDVLIVNGIGHDEWAFEIVEAAGRADDLPLIYANATVALIPIGGANVTERVVNPHTFVSTTAAIQQVYEIARALGELDPENAAAYRANAREYGARIRELRAGFMEAFAALDTSAVRAATAHAGYDYLFQEFGLEVAAVIEPRHGVEPTAAQLAQTIEDIRAANVNILFAELYYAGELAETINRETGVRVYPLSHISSGPYTAEKYEVEMQQNIETVLRAITETTAP
ncbi:MAG: metal ABC transporter solute-binding protein, Zn/Mn family [Bauldia sp.]